MQKNKIIQISTFRPEKCGIASWTEDVINYSHKQDSSLRNRVFAVNGYRQAHEYADFVDFCIEKDNLDDYFRAAEEINLDSNVGVVSVQHEFGIFGGHMGDHLIPFLESIKKPKLLTLHTVPREEDSDYTDPVRTRSAERRKVLKKILPLVDKTIAISDTARNILLEEYGYDSDKTEVILHGTHEFSESIEDSKKILGLEDRFVISTVGLVRSKRGLEYAIRALPPVVEKFPNVIYVLAGETHPREIVDGRDVYREQLMAEAENLGVRDNVHFVNNYLPLNSLLRHIQASDVGITPYTFPGQISSGVLSYYVGLDKPVVATPFLYAQELLGEGRGVVLPDYNNPESMSSALIDLVGNPGKLEEIRTNIGSIKGKLLWPNVAQAYIDAEKSLISQ